MTAKRIYSTPLGSSRGLGLGGAGSGHHGHEGRPGERGGSQEGDKQTVEDAQKTKREGDVSAVSLVRSLAAEAAKHEPELTKKLIAAIEKLGGQLAGLQHRLKKHPSILSKIQRGMREAGVSAEDAASGLNDAIRYTAVFEHEEFTEKVLETQAMLAEDGWSMFDHKWKNFFSPGNSYQGYNTVMVNSAGLRFELQFHTKESLTIKARAHNIYVESRELPQASPRRYILAERMSDLWMDYSRPIDWKKLPGRLVIR